MNGWLIHVLMFVLGFMSFPGLLLILGAGYVVLYEDEGVKCPFSSECEFKDSNCYTDRSYHWCKYYRLFLNSDENRYTENT
jgi:hypothetical protein